MANLENSVQSTYHSQTRSDVFPFIRPGGRLLDIGGGVGATAAAAKREGLAEYVGVADMVEPEYSEELDFNRQGDLTSPGFIEDLGKDFGPFDTILACDVLEHFTDPWAIIERLRDQLTPNGQIVASIPNVRHYSASVPLFLRGKWDYTDAGILDRTHFRFFTRDTAKDLLDIDGLKIVKFEGKKPTRRRDKIINAVSFGMLKEFFALQYISVAEKS